MPAPDQLDNSLEALTNLLYLIQRSLDGRARAEAYLDLRTAGLFPKSSATGEISYENNALDGPGGDNLGEAMVQGLLGGEGPERPPVTELHLSAGPGFPLFLRISRLSGG
jgi:hypothetical protein